MAIQTHTAALHGLQTVKLAAVSLVSSNLRAVIRAALIAAPYSLAASAADAILVRMKHADMLVVAGPIYMSDAGNVVDTNSTPYDVGEKREIRNCKELLSLATIFAGVAYDVRVELYS